VLRAAAVALIGLLLARPIVPSRVAGGLVPASPFERIIVLDDSLSMQSRLGNETAWERANEGGLNLIRSLAAQSSGQDKCTLLVPSQPDQPIIGGAALRGELIEEWQLRLNDWKCGDGSTNLAGTFRWLSESIGNRTDNVNRAVYVFTDLRQVDWQQSGNRPDEAATVFSGLKQLSQQVQGCFLIDTGDQRDGNLTVTRAEAEGPIVSDVAAAIDVSVKNQGSASVERVAVKLLVEKGLPRVETIERLAPGETSMVRFYATFAGEAAGKVVEKASRHTESRRVRVELKCDEASNDLLAGDSTFYFPARVRRGIQTLLVDGDAGGAGEKSESFFLLRALAPAGDVKSGVATHVVAEAGLDSMTFSDFDVVFLLNCDPLGIKPQENVQRLKQWVVSGGALVLMPGDRTDAAQFNQLLWQDGRGLSPFKLSGTVGDSAQQAWLSLRLTENNALLPLLGSEQQMLLQDVKFYRSWRANLNQGADWPEVEAVALFNDAEHSPAIAVRSLGEGHVVAFAMPADADWHNWPSSPSYVLLVQELVQSLIGNDANRGLLRVGQPIGLSLDMAQYEPEAVLEDPEESKINVAATPTTSRTNSPQWQMTSAIAKRLGFYEVSLARRGEGQEQILFAANADSGEGDLKRVDLAELKRALSGTQVRIIAGNDGAMVGDQTQRQELSRYLAWLLVAILASEQALGWLFGRQRI
jgi:hypothetical protein